MAETDRDVPSPKAKRPRTRNKKHADPEGEKINYDELLSELRTYLPFITKLIETGDMLDMSPLFVTNLMILSISLGTGRLSKKKFKICIKFLNDLFQEYGELLILMEPQRQSRNHRYHGA